MSMPVVTYRFAGHAFEPRTGEIERPDGSVERLQPQPAAILELLLERAPELVTREDLQARVWPDTKVEFDQGINFCVRRVREALGESAAEPRFVETLPRRGYRFLQPVERVAEDHDPPVSGGLDAGGPAEDGPSAPGPPRERERRASRAALGVPVLLALLATAWVLGSRNDGPAAEPATSPSAAARPRIAVLPFRDGDGAAGAGLALAEALTARLTSDPSLGVVGPASTRPFTGERAVTGVVGRELGVDYVLSGSLEPRADSTDFFAQLVRVADLEHVWAERVTLPGSPSAGVEAASATAARPVLAFLAARDTGRTASGVAWERSGEGPAVVLVHGSNLDRRLWAEEARLLRERRTVVRYDLRGHGASAGVEGPWSDADDLRDVLDAAGVERADVVGLSAGARVALDLALAHPERVRSLVLVSPTVGGYVPSAEERPAFAEALGRALRAGDLDGAADVLLATPVFTVPEAARPWVAAMVRENDRIWSMDPSLALPLDPPAVERLREVRAPTLVLAGGDDLLAVRRQAELLGREVPGARLRTVPGGGHLLNLTDPRAFRAELFGFLGVEGGGR